MKIILSYIRNDSCLKNKKKLSECNLKKKQLNISYKTMAE